MAKLVMCGKLKKGFGFSPIYCDPTTGDVVLDSDAMGKCIISNVSITDPINVPDGVFDKIISDTNAAGVIMSDTYLVVLQEDTAEFREYANAMETKMVVDYDLDMEYEGTIY